jgi:hypothetical protein
MLELDGVYPAAAFWRVDVALGMLEYIDSQSSLLDSADVVDGEYENSTLEKLGTWTASTGSSRLVVYVVVVFSHRLIGVPDVYCAHRTSSSTSRMDSIFRCSGKSDAINITKLKTSSSEERVTMMQ